MTECAVGPCHEPRVKESSFCPKHETDVETDRRVAPKPPMRFTSGHKLHYRDCGHFDDALPPREATDEELRTMSPCTTCLGQPDAGRSRSGGSVLLLKPQFRCPGCQLTKDLARQMPGGFCIDCTY
jgi:hypothetical protein